MIPNARLFLDTSVVFAGIWSAEGGARMLLRLGEAGAVELFVSSQVLEEIDGVLHRKAVHLLPTLAILLERSRVAISPGAPDELFRRCHELIPHSGDAHILADAWHAQVDFLVTLDKAHFIVPGGLLESVPFLIGTPGDCLAWLRTKFVA